MRPKYILPIIAAAFAAPVFMFAQAQQSPFAEACLIRVFHTNFQGSGDGKLVEKDGVTYFARTNLPGCENSVDGLVVITPTPQSTPPAQSNSFGSGFVNFLMGDECRVPVYHADFPFPPEGGVIIRTDGDMFFVPTYLPSCAGSVDGAEIVRSQSSAPIQTPQVNTTGGQFLNFVMGDACLVPIYHTNFSMPAEGGTIIEKDGDLYFAKTKERGCESSASSGTIVR